MTNLPELLDPHLTNEMLCEDKNFTINLEEAMSNLQIHIKEVFIFTICNYE